MEVVYRNTFIPIYILSVVISRT